MFRRCLNRFWRRFKFIFWKNIFHFCSTFWIFFRPTKSDCGETTYLHRLTTYWCITMPNVDPNSRLDWEILPLKVDQKLAIAEIDHFQPSPTHLLLDMWNNTFRIQDLPWGYPTTTLQLPRKWVKKWKKSWKKMLGKSEKNDVKK